MMTMINDEDYLVITGTAAEPAVRFTLDQPDRDWPTDKEERLQPDIMTSLFHSAVPVLKFIDWRVVHTGRGEAETILPLNVTSTDQHITHQAAVMLIAADYTGGLALSSLFHRVPIIGFHAQQTDYGAYLWGAKAEIRWLRPSTDDLVCTARIPPERHERIVRRFFPGQRVLETVRVEMKNKDEPVAEANFTYWVQDTHSMRRNAFDENKVHALFDHRHKASALLIAGLRALEQDLPEPDRLFHDPVAKAVAGNHGMLLAKRFCIEAPQIQPVVAARTKHLDDLLGAFHCGHPCQVVSIGAGLDSRIYRVELPKGSKVFDLDLPIMFHRRREVLASLPIPCNVKRIEVPIDLREHDVSDAIADTVWFVPAAPTLVIWEGGSMYFDADDNRRIRSSVAKLIQNPKSRFWMDYVHSSVVDGTSEFPVVQRFMQAMRSLGEPFITGFADISHDFAKCGLTVEETVPSSVYLNTPDPVFEVYRFCVAKAANV